MRSVDSQTLAAIQNRGQLVLRRLIWIRAKNRSTGAAEEAGFWNDVTDISVGVISGQTFQTVTRSFTASGSLISVSPIPQRADLTIRQVRITLSQVNDAVANAIRGYDPRLAPIEIYNGLLDPDTMTFVAAPYPVFVGHVNKAPIKTPPAGQEGSVEITAVSATRLLTRTNPAKRSHESQVLRDGCGFYRYANIAGTVEVHWGGEGRTAGREPDRPVEPPPPVVKTS